MMMKLLAVALILVPTVCCQKKRNDDELVAVGNRKIKMIMESVHDPIFKTGKFESSAKPSKNSSFYESHFSKKGILVRRNTFNSNAVLQSKIIFNYDQHDN